MSRSPAGTTFKLRTPAHIESCHLVGSWDNYGKRYTMAADTAAGAGWWKLTLKFPTSGVQRFWYYYVLDGYFESHDPNRPTCKEPTRGITLNILDCGAATSPTPSSASSWSSSSSHSSRFPSPSSSVSPVSASSGKSYRSRPAISDPVLRGSSALPPSSHSHRRRNSPPPARPASHIVQPVPRNPLTQHKLTLDTSCRPISMITTAATTAGDSPISASSSRSASSLGSFCSSCSSGSTVFSEDSPTTPICHCGGFESGCESEGESCCSEESYQDEHEQYRRVRISRRASYHPAKAGHGGQLAYELERRLRM
ncbi:unnamed protein product [Tuber aestivum]|uniref:Uncharacterized protein n=1 Tax=Tuber aestivum TaxID=59557 RepID=A0A292PXJ2_9PEZI|nr:unnamed protein product [Tuber aestivum]